MKKTDPSCRFRIETNILPKVQLFTSKIQEQGLEAPESFFVELADWEKENGPACPEDICSEWIDDKWVQGVPCMIQHNVCLYDVYDIQLS